MNKEEMRNCPQCENYCPEDDLRCGRGRRYFSEDGEEMIHEGHHGPHGEGRHHPGPHDGGERPHCGRGEGHEERRPHPPLDPERLEDLVRMCARKMHHERHGHYGSTQDDIIRILSENGGTMGQKALQELLHVRPGSISEILAKMEEKELIVRTKDADDRRASLITLKADSLPERERPDFFAALSEEEKEQLKTLLKKVLQNRIPE